MKSLLRFKFKFSSIIFLFLASVFLWFGVTNLYSSPEEKKLEVAKPAKPLIYNLERHSHNCRILGWWYTTGYPATPSWDPVPAVSVSP